MKKITVSARDLFRGEAVGGLTYEEWTAADELARLRFRLSHIADRAQALAETPYTSESDFPGNMLSRAQALAQTARNGLKAVEAGEIMAAAWYAIDTGKQMGELNQLLTAWDQVQVIVNYRKSMQGRAEKKRGHKSPLTKAIREMVERIPDCSYADLLTEMEADAQGRECLLYDLREEGLITVRFVAVTAEQITYDILNGAKGRTLKTRTLNNKLTEARNPI